MPDPVLKKLSVWEWMIVIPLGLIVVPIVLAIELIGKVLTRKNRWSPPPDEGADGLGVPAGLVPGPPSLVCKHAEKWPSEFETE